MTKPHIFHNATRTFVIHAENWDEAAARLNGKYDIAHDVEAECERCPEPAPLIDWRTAPGS